MATIPEEIQLELGIPTNSGEPFIYHLEPIHPQTFESLMISLRIEPTI